MHLLHIETAMVVALVTKQRRDPVKWGGPSLRHILSTEPVRNPMRRMIRYAIYAS